MTTLHPITINDTGDTITVESVTPLPGTSEPEDVIGGLYNEDRDAWNRLAVMTLARWGWEVVATASDGTPLLVERQTGNE